MQMEEERRERTALLRSNVRLTPSLLPLCPSAPLPCPWEMAPRGPDSCLQGESQAAAETPHRKGSRDKAAVSGWEEKEEETFGIKGVGGGVRVLCYQIRMAGMKRRPAPRRKGNPFMKFRVAG